MSSTNSLEVLFQKRTIYSFSVLTILTLTSFTFQISDRWAISQEHSVKFETSYASGEFTTIEGSIIFDHNNLEVSKFDITIDVSSISTGNSLKDRHAKKEKWFGVDKHPTIRFISNNITKKSSGYETNGILNLHGVKKKINIPFTFDNNTFQGSFDVNRLDYNVGTDTGFSSIVGTEVHIDLNIPVTKI